jgi:NAD(P)-dependent dehydrogenase (short-subunit alcohol dehydrogenase family)
MPGLLQNHIAVVTGAGSGIGRGIALGYGREGAQVVSLDINGETAGKTATDIRAEGGRAHHFTLDVNLNGVFNVTHAFLDALRASKGRIVNIASIQSFMHVRTPNSPAYTSAKHGVLGFTRALAAELGKHGVRVNAIGPGLIETPLNAQVRANNPELVKIFLDHTPLGRAGKPEDIAGPAIFLASDLSAYVTGAIVMADGGYRTI